MSETITTIKVTVGTRDRLKELGKKGQSYNNIVVEMLNNMKNSKTKPL